jgi:hypothetical protein
MSKQHVYDNYEISGCRYVGGDEQDGRQAVEPCDDAESQFWTLYGHIDGQGVEAIGDFPSRQVAEEVYYRITGQPFSGLYEADARLRPLHAAPVTPQPAMQEYHLDGKRCPRCNNVGPFLLEVTETVTVRQDGTLDIVDDAWGLDIDCACPKCGFAGRLEAFCEWVEVTGQERERAIEETSGDHTPGPWQQSWQFIVAPDRGGIHPDIYLAEIAESDSEGRIASPEQQEANGRLIVAAPDLLAACRLVVARWQRGDLAAAARACQAAITLATDGRPPWDITNTSPAPGNPYAVLLLYPDHANDSGTETYYAFVTASDPLAAVTLAQRQATDAQEGVDIEPDDFVPLLVTPGHPTSEPLFNK